MIGTIGSSRIGIRANTEAIIGMHLPHEKSREITGSLKYVFFNDLPHAVIIVGRADQVSAFSDFFRTVGDRYGQPGCFQQADVVFRIAESHAIFNRNFHQLTEIIQGFALVNSPDVYLNEQRSGRRYP